MDLFTPCPPWFRLLCADWKNEAVPPPCISLCANGMDKTAYPPGLPFSNGFYVRFHFEIYALILTLIAAND